MEEIIRAVFARCCKEPVAVDWDALSLIHFHCVLERKSDQERTVESYVRAYPGHTATAPALMELQQALVLEGLYDMVTARVTLLGRGLPKYSAEYETSPGRKESLLFYTAEQLRAFNVGYENGARPDGKRPEGLSPEARACYAWGQGAKAGALAHGGTSRHALGGAGLALGSDYVCVRDDVGPVGFFRACVVEVAPGQPEGLAAVATQKLH